MTTRYLVIGDVHSENAQLRALVSNTNFDKAIFLGDLIDRGPDATGVVKIVDELDREGRLEAVVVGNHDHKVFRFFRGAEVKLSHEAQRTVENLLQNGAADLFSRIIKNSWLAYKLGRNIFVHAASSRTMYRDEFASMPYYSTFFEGQGKKSGTVSHCLYGYTTGRKTPEGFPERLMDWVQAIPRDFVVWKGHDYVHDEVTFEGNNLGGMLVWMDTGAGKMGDREGKLSGHVLEI